MSVQKKKPSFAASLVGLLFLCAITVLGGVFVGLMSRLVWEGFSWGWGLFGL